MRGAGACLGSRCDCLPSTGARKDDRKGEDITRLDSLPAADIILINPRIALPTDKVFAALNCHDEPPAQPLRRPIYKILEIYAIL